jgi:hypothetical protein
LRQGRRPLGTTGPGKRETFYAAETPTDDLRWKDRWRWRRGTPLATSGRAWPPAASTGG